jgi:hypothetical protein
MPFPALLSSAWPQPAVSFQTRRDAGRVTATQLSHASPADVAFNAADDRVCIPSDPALSLAKAVQIWCSMTSRLLAPQIVTPSFSLEALSDDRHQRSCVRCLAG